MTADERTALAERVLGHARAEAAEVTVTYERRALTRFTRETITQNVDESDTLVQVRAIVDGRTGIAATNRTDDASLAAVAARAEELATFAPRDERPPHVAAPAAVESPAGAYVAATAAASPERRAGIAHAIFGHARRGGLWSAGYVVTSASGVTLATSRGARLSFDATHAGANTKMSGADASGFAERYAPDIAQIDGDAVGARAAAKAGSSRAPCAVEPGDWTVILEPAAFGELLAYLGAHFSAEAFAEGSSFASGKLGEPLLGAGVTIRDDYRDPLNPGMPFDFEGTPTQPVTLVDDGVVRGIVTDARWAARLDRANTGHATPPADGAGPAARHLVVGAGSASVDELIARTPRGLLITRLWYVRVVDQRTVLLTGMTRDGTFLIEDGVVGPGVRNMRFNVSLVDALGDCEFANDPTRTGGYSYALVTPSVKLARFRFASVSPY
jgi:predicted Zn-dependent protease